MDEPPLDGSEALQLVLAACKFLDLLLVIQSEDFQMCVFGLRLQIEFNACDADISGCSSRTPQMRHIRLKSSPRRASWIACPRSLARTTNLSR